MLKYASPIKLFVIGKAQAMNPDGSVRWVITLGANAIEPVMQIECDGSDEWRFEVGQYFEWYLSSSMPVVTEEPVVLSEST